MSQSAIVTIGNFDGVHLGHQSILQDVREQADMRRLRSYAITFDPHPATVLGYDAPKLLTTIDFRKELIRRFGVDECVVLPFTRDLAEKTAQQFLRMMIQDYGMEMLCIGPNTHIGKDRVGTPKRIGELSKSMEFELMVSAKMEVQGETISSSLIRKIIETGDVRKAHQLLGRAHVTEGVVVRGASRGKGLGFPTANLDSIVTLLPTAGVYVTQAAISGKKYGSVTNIGTRPTFESSGSPICVEVHVFGFEGDLVGQRVQLEWLARLRDEKKFSSPDELKSQIEKDISKAHEVLRASLHFMG